MKKFFTLLSCCSLLASWQLAHGQNFGSMKIDSHLSFSTKRVNYAPDPMYHTPPPSELSLSSSVALIYDRASNKTLYSKNPDRAVPIASITKLMTAMVVLDARLPMSELISIEEDDVDTIKGTHSRLQVGTVLTRGELLRLALMSSENRAAAALARTYPGGTRMAVRAMNEKADALGMFSSRFVEATGLSSRNVSTANDLVAMVAAASRYQLIHEYTTSDSHIIYSNSGREIHFKNTNPLVRDMEWQIGLSKTGFINEAGRCLVMEATIDNRNMILVLLDSNGKLTRIGDANRVKQWLEQGSMRTF